MATSVITKVLGVADIPTEHYYRDTFRLAKSIVIADKVEAELYNEYIAIHYPGHSVLSDKRTWRYYKHLNAELHALDREVIVMSLDTGVNISLTRSALEIHSKTRAKLCEFGMFYRDLVLQYPEQELYIRACMGTALISGLDALVSATDYSIVAYNQDLVEANELDIIYQLQARLNNYKHLWLISYYSLSDTLFKASQFHVLYNFIFTSILALRAANIKTHAAHSYHVKNYLASHHGLDAHYRHLTTRQRMFLYRNMLYLDNHSGKNSVFETLTDELFTRRKITLVRYDAHQRVKIGEDYKPQSVFKQKLLNDANFSHDKGDYSLSRLLDKESLLAPSNAQEIIAKQSEIDDQLAWRASALLQTKDLESIVIDSTDAVRHKLIPMLVDHWAYYLKTARMSHLIEVNDPVTNQPIVQSASDMFKLFSFLLCKSRLREFEHFPKFFIMRVAKEEMPHTDALLASMYRSKPWYRECIESLKATTPTHVQVATPLAFEQQIRKIYYNGIAQWRFVSGLFDIHSNVQFEMVLERLYRHDHYDLGGEALTAYLDRTGLAHMRDYTIDSCERLITAILDSVFNNRLDFLYSMRDVQAAITSIFKRFNSYSTQFIDTYYSSNHMLAGPKGVRASLSGDAARELYEIELAPPYLEVESKHREAQDLARALNVRDASTSQTERYSIPLEQVGVTRHQAGYKIKIALPDHLLSCSSELTDWLSDDELKERLLFLATGERHGSLHVTQFNDIP